MVARRLALGSLLAVLLVPAAARADEPLGTVAKATPVVADAGFVAWRGDDGRLLVRQGEGAVRTTSLRPPASARFDVGSARGGAQVVWTEGCSTRTRRCVVRGATLTAASVGRARAIARIPYRGGGSPAVAVDGSRLAYTLRSGACDVPYAGARRLDRGHCARIAQLDLDDGWVAVLASPVAVPRSTEARVVRWRGGPSRLLQRESQGEESNFIGSVSIDRGALFLARAGIRQPDAYIKRSFGGTRRSEARALVTLQGAFARDGGRTVYLQAVDYESSGDCGCLVVAGQDPFTTARRTLAPQVAITVAPQPVYVDTAPRADVAVTRPFASRTAITGRAPVAGAAVELLMSVPTDLRAVPAAPAPTGATATTGADGVARIAIPGAAAPFRYLAATAQVGDAPRVAVPTDTTTFLRTFAHMTASATRLADGRVQVTGAISPALPGRKVRLDRKQRQVCNAYVTVSGTPISPSQADAPAGCVDDYTQNPVATADVSADGASYTVIAPASATAGTYRVALDFANGALVFPGESAPFAVP
jgi:hypothetical protein